MQQTIKKSQTTAILYRQPTQTEMHPKPNLLNRFGDIVAVAILITIIMALFGIVE